MTDFGDKVVLNTGEYSGAVSSLRKVEGIIAGTTTYAENSFNTEFHYHSNPHLSFVLQGGNIENRKKKTIERTVGDIMFFHSGEIHQTLPANCQTKNMNLELECSFLEQYAITEEQVSRMVDQNMDSKFLILRMYKELIENDQFSDVSIQLLLLSTISKPVREDRYHNLGWIKALSEVLHDEWTTFHNLDDLSVILNVHPVTISKYFTKNFGCTLGEYMRKIKIEKSLSLIQNKSQSLTEIALECGFADQSHFIRNFKKFTGQLPKEFQKL
jgi:AraC family transcriptional regulator